MKLSDYRNKVWESYPDSFMDYDSNGNAVIYKNSLRYTTIGHGKTPLLAWQDAWNRIDPDHNYE